MSIRAPGTPLSHTGMVAAKSSWSGSPGRSRIDFDTYLFYLAIASDVFYGCIIEHFQDQGGWYADSRVNVGEPSQPINGSGFIQDTELNGKLSTPLWW
jgi:hypothetical protein